MDWAHNFKGEGEFLYKFNQITWFDEKIVLMVKSA